MTIVYRTDYQDFREKFYNGGFKGQRFGQAFSNAFLTRGEAKETRLFFEYNDEKAKGYIETNFVDWSL